MSSPSNERITAFQTDLLSWAADGNLREFPWRTTDSAYEVLVAEILLQQTLATKVVPVYDAFFERYPTPADAASANRDDVADVLEPLGFHNQRAAALVDNGATIRDQGLPRSVEALKQLHYVGDYAANTTACFGYGQRCPIVDTNVVRIYERVFDLELDPQAEGTWSFATQLLPAKDFKRYNLALLDLGAEVCKSKTPLCEQCPVRTECTYYST